LIFLHHIVKEEKMTRKPDREHVKKAIQFKLSRDIYELVNAFLKREDNAFRSLSQFTEILIFSARDTYSALPTKDFVYELRRIKAMLYTSSHEYEKPDPKKQLHVTIDVDALHFVETFLRKYRSSFSSRSELIELFFLRFVKFNDKEGGSTYILERMKQAQLNNPVRIA
jgi:hypothetical protein